MSLARDGIAAHSAALHVTGQNVAGANTPGYVKRTATLSSTVGGGVEMSAVARNFDRFTYSQLVDQSGRLAAATARATAISDVEVLATPASDHIGDRADALFDALHELALPPSSDSARASVLARAAWLAAGFSETADGLDAFRTELGTRASEVVGEVNDRLASLVMVDEGIVAARARGEQANDLIDTRDRLVKEIAERVGARAIDAPNGGITIFGAGTVLYEARKPTTLVSSLDIGGSLRIQSNREGVLTDVTKAIDTGTLAGIRQARDVDIPGLLDSLDAFAKDLADSVNAIHTTGFGLDGNSGRPLFTPSATVKGAAHAMEVDLSVRDHPERVAAAGAAADVPGGNDIAVKLSDLARAPLAGTGTAGERFAAFAGKVGVLRTVTRSDEEMRKDTVATATSLREGTSGVSTDEEMIQLQQFQRGFEASTRVLRTVDSLFDSIFQLVR